MEQRLGLVRKAESCASFSFHLIILLTSCVFLKLEARSPNGKDQL
jgi:hypothetical protein